MKQVASLFDLRENPFFIVHTQKRKTDIWQSTHYSPPPFSPTRILHERMIS